MKKLLTVAAIAGAASLSYGQGYVETANNAATKLSAGGAAATAAGNFLFELLVAPSTTTTIGASLAGWTDTVDYLTISTSGRVVPGNNTSDQLGSEIPGYGPNATADFAVVGWSASLGTYADALSWWNDGGALTGNAGPDPGLALGAGIVYFGISTVADSVILSPSGGPYNSIWGPASDSLIQGMNLTAVDLLAPGPEPSTFALCGLGAATLLFFRRRT